MSRLRKPSSNKPYISELDIFTTYSNPHKIEFLDFKLICKTFFYLLTKYAVDHGDVYYLPSRLGTFGVRKKQAIGRGYFNYALYAAEGIKQ